MSAKFDTDTMRKIMGGFVVAAFGCATACVMCVMSDEPYAAMAALALGAACAACAKSISTEIQVAMIEEVVAQNDIMLWQIAADSESEEEGGDGYGR